MTTPASDPGLRAAARRIAWASALLAAAAVGVPQTMTVTPQGLGTGLNVLAAILGLLGLLFLVAFAGLGYLWLRARGSGSRMPLLAWAPMGFFVLALSALIAIGAVKNRQREQPKDEPKRTLTPTQPVAPPTEP